MAIRVICLGNELVGDDGVGIQIGRILEDLELPPNVIVTFHGGSIVDILEFIDSNDQFIFVDALKSDRPPGTVMSIDFVELTQLSSIPHSVHALGLEDILHVAAHLYPEKMPSKVGIVGIEVASIDNYCSELSRPVYNALPEAVTLVLNLLGGDKNLIAQGKQVAQARPNPLTIEDQFCSASLP